MNLQLAFAGFRKQTRRRVWLRKIHGDVLRAYVLDSSQIVTEIDQFVFGSSDEQKIVPARGELASKRFANSRRRAGDKSGVHETNLPSLRTHVFLAPSGATENSPAIYRWEQVPQSNNKSRRDERISRASIVHIEFRAYQETQSIHP